MNDIAINSAKIGELDVLWANPVVRLHSHPIVFVHGMWGNASQFTYWMQLAAHAGFVAYSINLKGHAETEKQLLKKTSLKQHVADIESVLHEIGGQVILIGHSMGGLLTQKLATQSRHVLVACPVASGPPRWIFLQGKILWRIWRYIPSMVFNWPFMLNNKDTQDLLFHPQAVNFSLRPESGGIARQAAMWLIGVSKKELRCPITFFGGTEDNMCALGMQVKNARMLGARMIKFTGVGHMLHLNDNEGVILRTILTEAGKSLSEQL